MSESSGNEISTVRAGLRLRRIRFYFLGGIYVYEVISLVVVFTGGFFLGVLLFVLFFSFRGIF